MEWVIDVTNKIERQILRDWRKQLTAERKKEPWPAFGFVSSPIDVRNGYNAAIDRLIEMLDEREGWE